MCTYSRSYTPSARLWTAPKNSVGNPPTPPKQKSEVYCRITLAASIRLRMIHFQRVEAPWRSQYWGSRKDDASNLMIAPDPILCLHHRGCQTTRTPRWKETPACSEIRSLGWQTLELYMKNILCIVRNPVSPPCVGEHILWVLFVLHPPRPQKKIWSTSKCKKTDFNILFSCLKYISCQLFLFHPIRQTGFKALFVAWEHFQSSQATNMNSELLVIKTRPYCFNPCASTTISEATDRKNKTSKAQRLHSHQSC